ncbi:hypothetical protein SMICM17S_11427 [Streptomyces microflavus]
MVRLGEESGAGGGEGIVRLDTEGSTLVKEVPGRRGRQQSGFTDDVQEVKADRSGTLAADLIGPDKVEEVWELPSLRTATDIVTAPPAENTSVRIFFGPRDELLTVSGTVIEHWNARDGRRLSKPVDLRGLKFAGKDLAQFTASFHPEPGHVQLLIAGEQTVRALSLRTGKENKALQVELEPDVSTAVLDRSGDFAVVQTKGSMVEVWSVRGPGQRPRRVSGRSVRWTASATSSTASGPTARCTSWPTGTPSGSRTRRIPRTAARPMCSPRNRSSWPPPRTAGPCSGASTRRT